MEDDLIPRSSALWYVTLVRIRQGLSEEEKFDVLYKVLEELSAGCESCIRRQKYRVDLAGANPAVGSTLLNEAESVRTQLDRVHLIFGGKR